MLFWQILCTQEWTVWSGSALTYLINMPLLAITALATMMRTRKLYAMKWNNAANVGHKILANLIFVLREIDKGINPMNIYAITKR